ncbi:MAG: hypothetical protein FJX54_02570 [Alphaproteobacteria bacterium]|nr:hypothetical protein [Alphaproteobacteria bacterium]
MIKEFWRGLSPHARQIAVVAAGGFVIGAIFGDLIFFVVELAVGDPLDELVFGIAGAVLATVIYETLTLFQRKS